MKPEIPVFCHEQQPVEREPVAEFRLLGRVPFGDCLALQNRLVDETAGRNDARIVVLLCEHPDLITVGRRGSRGHIRLTNQQLKREQLHVRWVRRGGGCVLHTPGQLAVYPIVPLDALGWRVGRYMRRLQQGIVEALGELNIRTEAYPRRSGVWGRSGQLASVGVAVRDRISYHGAFINVNPAMRQYAFVDALPPERVPPGEKATMGCLVAERQTAVRMTSVRATLVKALAAAFGCQRYHLYTGHPWLSRKEGTGTPLRPQLLY